MPRKVLWIVFWMTVMFWLGGFWGCAATGEDQNLKILEEDEAMFETEPPGLQSREKIADDLNVDLAADDAQATEAPETEAPQVAADTEPFQEHPEATAETTQDEWAADAVTIADPETAEESSEPDDLAMVPEPQDVIETEPSLSGLDRSHWPTQVVGASDGRTPHNPVYFVDVNLRKIGRRKDVAAAGEVEEMVDQTNDEPMLKARLEGAKSGNIVDKTNAVGLAVQPVKFALDLILLPIKAIIDFPLSTEKTGFAPRQPN